MKRLSRISLLSCAFASALLTSAAFEQTFIVAAAADGKKVAAIDDETLSLYPTAEKCGECHKQIYEEWASPATPIRRSRRCSTSSSRRSTICRGHDRHVLLALPPARRHALGRIARAAAVESSPVAREGVTCVTCHRVANEYGKDERRAPHRAGQHLRSGLRAVAKAWSRTVPTGKPIPSASTDGRGAPRSTPA